VPNQKKEELGGTEFVPAGKNLELKRAVAKKAAEHIRSGDSLIVTAGMTPHLTILQAKECRNLKIVTDSLLIAEDLCRNTDYQVVILGGAIDEENSFVYGSDAEKQVRRYMADKAIITADGVDGDAGFTTLRAEGENTLKSILARARVKIVAADITKIGKKSFCHIGDIQDADILVTNRTDDPEKLRVLREIEEAGVAVEYVEAYQEGK
jgi:DeoR/GlpR family transcriptional regulator of sugar metabolism